MGLTDAWKGSLAVSFTEEESFILQRRKFKILDDREGCQTLKCPACGMELSVALADEPHKKCIHLDGQIIAVEGCTCGHVACIENHPYARNKTLMPELRPYVDRR